MAEFPLKTVRRKSEQDGICRSSRVWAAGGRSVPISGAVLSSRVPG
jgi:hypothetical protein